MPAFDRIDRISEEVRRELDKIIREDVRDPRVKGTYSVTRADVTRITRRLGDDIARVYGFSIPRARQAPVMEREFYEIWNRCEKRELRGSDRAGRAHAVHCDAR